MKKLLTKLEKRDIIDKHSNERARKQRMNVRQQFISDAQSFATYFNSVATGLGEIQDSENEEIKSTVENINAIGIKISLLNKQINVIEVQGVYANELRDQRALLIDELSSIVPTEVSEVPVTNSKHPDLSLIHI